MSLQTYENLRASLAIGGCYLKNYAIAIGGFRTSTDANTNIGAPISMSPHGQDVKVAFMVVPSQALLLLGAPFMYTYGVSIQWDTSNLMDLRLSPRNLATPWTESSPSLSLPFFIGN